MVDISSKPVTVRQAWASGKIQMQEGVLDQLLDGALPKGDALATAKIAGIQAAKQTDKWIPLCHTLPLQWVDIQFDRLDRQSLRVCCRVKTASQTGVEMEALTGAAATCLTLYDMVKSADRAMVIGPIQLEYKSGGKSGTYKRDQ